MGYRDALAQEHAILERYGDQPLLMPMTSGPVLVNGKPIPRGAFLEPHDRCRAGIGASRKDAVERLPRLGPVLRLRMGGRFLRALGPLLHAGMQVQAGCTGSTKHALALVEAGAGVREARADGAAGP